MHLIPHPHHKNSLTKATARRPLYVATRWFFQLHIYSYCVFLPPLSVLPLLELASQKALKFPLVSCRMHQRKNFFNLTAIVFISLFFILITCDIFLGTVSSQTDETKHSRIILQMEFSVLFKETKQLHPYSWTFWKWCVLERGSRPLKTVDF